MTGAEYDAITYASVNEIQADLRKMCREANLRPWHMDTVNKAIGKLDDLLGSYLDTCATVYRLMETKQKESE